MRCPAKGVARAIIFFGELLGQRSCETTPNKAIYCKRLYIANVSEKNDGQKLLSFGQDQNTCKIVAGACLHRSHVGSMSGLFLANLTFDLCNRCATLNCMTECQ